MKEITFEEAKKKISRYCAYQERSHQEVKRKLYGFGLKTSLVNDLLAQLISEGFLNEERFAKAFAGGKFRLKKWGRLKIIRELEARGLTPNCIRAGLKEIDEEKYLETLVKLIDKKMRGKSDENEFAYRDKVAKSIILKGFEPELVWREVKKKWPV